MRPVWLELSAFGAFPGTETIDFDDVGRDGLFLVTGPTGAGKSTIFDAMCWALYGETPRGHEVRSHLVSAHARCEVRLRFAVGGVTYEVTRNPEQKRPHAKNADRLVTEDQDAHVVRIEPDGSTTPLAAGWTNSKNTCTDLLGLDRGQFERVILLPQGAFSRFLLADTGGREALLRKLFGTVVYEKTTDRLKKRASTLRRESDADETRTVARLSEAHRALLDAEHALTNEDTGSTATADDEPAERATVETLRDRVDAALGALATEQRDLEEAATAATARVTALRDETRRFAEATRARSILEGLDRDTEKIEAIRVAHAASVEATPIVAADDAARDAGRDLDGLTTGHAARVDILSRVFCELGVPVADPTPVACAEARSTVAADLQRRRGLLDALEAAVTAEAGARAAHDGIDGRIAEARTTEKVTADAIAALEAERSALADRPVEPEEFDRRIATLADRRGVRAGIDADETDLVTATQQLDEAAQRYRDTLERFVTGQAPRLAETLVEGGPCPVCGSADHPAPARATGAESVSAADLDAANAHQTTANARVVELQGRIEERRARLGDEVDRTVAEWDDSIATVRTEREVAVRARARLTELDTEVGTLTARITAVRDTVATREQDRAAAAARLSDATNRRETSAAAASVVDAAELPRQEALLTEAETALDGFAALDTQLTTTRTAVATHEATVARLLGASRFATIDEARAARLDDAVMADHARQVHEHDDARTAAHATLASLADQGIPETDPDLGPALASQEQTTTALDAVKGRLATATAHRQRGANALDEHAVLHEQTAALRDEASRAERVATVCAKGSVELPLSLERWVLSRELDRILSLANHHLAAMTGSRYALARRRERAGKNRLFGLDLDVFDANSGRSREPRSLSGGERFQASLALALGLADVIAHGGTAGGQRFESLFVDEGFGSLDAEALEEAVATLVALQGTGRMVGAITHVEAMKENLPTGIVVRRLPDGRGSTLESLE